jgi:hypothetical protein
MLLLIYSCQLLCDGYAKAGDRIELGKAEDFVKINKTEDTGEYRQS